MVFNIFLQNQKYLLNILKNLYKNKILKTWNENHLDFTFEKKTSGSIKYILKKANNDLAKYNLKNIKKSFNSPIFN